MGNRKRKYTQRVVLLSSRRVLRLLRGYVASNVRPRTLWAHCGGFMTREELLDHIDAVLALQVKSDA